MYKWYLRNCIFLQISYSSFQWFIFWLWWPICVNKICLQYYFERIFAENNCEEMIAGFKSSSSKSYPDVKKKLNAVLLKFWVCGLTNVFLLNHIIYQWISFRIYCQSFLNIGLLFFVYFDYQFWNLSNKLNFMTFALIC